VSPVRYELCLYIPEDGILYSHHCENLKSHKICALHNFYNDTFSSSGDTASNNRMISD
jgi:hypothetical protein